MDTLGFDQTVRQSMWRILAGILTLGNVEFRDDSTNAQTGQTLVKVANPNGNIFIYNITTHTYFSC